MSGNESKKTKIFIPHIGVITSGGGVTAYAFDEHELVMPSVYLNILQNISKQANYEGDGAHAFMKEIGELIENKNFSKNEGIVLNEEGRFRICEANNVKKSGKNSSSENLEEILILTADQVKKANPDRQVVVLVSGTDEKTILDYRLKGKDIKVEKARFITLKPEILEEGLVNLNVEGELISKLHSTGLVPEDLNDLLDHEVRPNQFFKLSYDGKDNFSVARQEKDGIKITSYDMGHAMKKKIFEGNVGAKSDNYQQAILMDYLLDPKIQLVVAAGGVGTGKTFLSYASGLWQILKEKETYSKLILSKPEVSIFEGIGFLPGSETEKTLPWLASFSTNHKQIGIQHREHGNATEFEDLIDRGIIEARSLSFIQGASYSNTIYLIDEFQNLAPHHARAILSRGAEGSKFIIMGDIDQVTNRRSGRGEQLLTSKYNGLLSVVDHFGMINKSPHVGFIRLEIPYRNEVANLALDWKPR